MRIIGGQFKGRRFHPPAKNWPTRPTTDFAKEGLFNILANFLDFESTKVLDLFGGTGSHGYEFISRGCTDVTYVDHFPACVTFVKKISAIEFPRASGTSSCMMSRCAKNGGSSWLPTGYATREGDGCLSRAKAPLYYLHQRLCH